MPKQIAIIGGGAAGFFLAANLPKSKAYKVRLFEKSSDGLQKVKISGGGRCNLTHAEFIPAELVKNYPRGEKELRSVFAKFQPADTFEWFQKRGLELKVEEDNRVFPSTDSSQSVIDILEREAEINEVEISLAEALKSIEKVEELWKITTSKNSYLADYLVISTGSSKALWDIISTQLGHTIVSPVPSLFTFNCSNPLIEELSGTSFPYAEIKIPSIGLSQSGPLLITHWGFSGPAILKLSAFGARKLAECAYQFSLTINWLGESPNAVYEELKNFKSQNPSQKIVSTTIFPTLTKKYWKKILAILPLDENRRWAEISTENLQKLTEILCHTQVEIEGKSTFKEEFVTAGGIDLKEIDMRNLQSKLHPNLFFAGEVLNIDGITGGFNFQACWSEAYLIAEYLKNSIS